MAEPPLRRHLLMINMPTQDVCGPSVEFGTRFSAPPRGDYEEVGGEALEKVH